MEAEEESESSGGSVLPEVHRRGQDKLVVAVGPAGGTLELDNGARLVIPKGAIPENTEVTLAAGARTSAFSNHDYEKALGPIVEVVIESGVQAPVEVSIPLTKIPEGFEEKDLTLGVEVPASSQRYESANTQTRWDYLSAESRSGRAVAKLEPPGYRVQFLVSKND
ncbi:MAG TPA: hypothetical protein VFX59_14795 [Polyangiales bacterium]|nr:hypothetical protein [Polyangiales bacterium]